MEGKYYRFKKQELNNWIRSLSRKYQVWTPVKREKQTDFQLDASSQETNLEYSQGHLGIKKIFFPSSEILFKVKRGKTKIPALEKPIAVIGAHPVDLIGLQRLDESFSQAPSDFYWQRRRENCLLVGTTPLKNHKYFTDSLGDFPIVFDLFFHNLAKTYFLVEVGSKKGRKLIQNNQLFQKTSQKITVKHKKRNSDFLLSDPLIISKIIQNSRNSKIWKELGRICFNCGICTYVCPLCYCFSMTDKISSRGDSCQRCRRWDACTLASFSQISGGYNFRPKPEDRLYNWYYHKFVRAPKERGKIDCIGCHRCIDFCPAGIDFKKVIRQLAKEQKIE